MDRRELTEYDCEQLRELKGKKIFVVVRSVSTSGMTRKMNFYFTNKKGDMENITSIISKLTDYGCDKNGTLIVRECGMNMLFAILYKFNCAMIKLEELEITKISHSERRNFWINADNYQLI